MTRTTAEAHDEPGARFDIFDEVAVITLARPPRRSQHIPPQWPALADFAARLPGTVRVVVVRGLGGGIDGGADADILSTGGTDPTGRERPVALETPAAQAMLALDQAAFGWLDRTDIVSVAAIDGHVVGAGFRLALACDLRLAGEDAAFTVADVRRGLVPALGATHRLVDLIGYARAVELCLTGRRLGAGEALAIGLVNRVVAATHLVDATDATVRALLAAPREAVIEAKSLLRRASSTSQAEQEAAERAAQLRLLRGLAGIEAD